MDNLEETLGNLGLEERVRYHDIIIFLFLPFSNGNDRKGGSKETARGETRGRQGPGAKT